MFVDEKLRNNDPDIRNAIINTEKYLIKYVDEYGELIEQYKNEIPSLGMQYFKFYSLWPSFLNPIFLSHMSSILFQ